MTLYSEGCRSRITPQLKRIDLLSGRTETLEGGVVVRKSAHVSGQLVKRPSVATGGKLTVSLLNCPYPTNVF